MRRFLTLVGMLCLAIPAGISISGCTRNPDANFCNGLGFGLKITDVDFIQLTPITTGVSMAYGQTQQIGAPTAKTCRGTTASVASYTYGTSNNQLLDISPAGNMCAGTWNRNTGGGIANFTICTKPDPQPATNGLPYSIAYVTASAQSVTSNPVPIYVHDQVTSVSLVTTPLSGNGNQCFSQGQQATLDAQACFVYNGKQQTLCAPPSVATANLACGVPTHIVNGVSVPVTPDIIASGTFIGPPAFSGSITGGEFESGGTISGATGDTCILGGFNNGSNGATATVALTGANTIASGTALTVTAGGTGATSPPTSATLSNGTATCSGTATIVTGPIIGTAGETCNLSGFNNNSNGATATVTLTGANTIASGIPLVIITGGGSATSPPTSAVLSNGTATCSGTATVATTLTPVPDCTSSIGTLNYIVGSPNIGTITTNTNNGANQVTITAGQPGTTVITAQIAGSGSSAGYFSTCPPKSINVTLANGQTSGTVTQGVTQNLTTTVIDTAGNPITGLSLVYQSTDPIDIAAGSGGAITTNFPAVASVNAICQPSACNPAPINEVGLYGTGLPISSNPVKITVPGPASDFLWFGAPGQSQYFVPVELLSGTVGSTVRLPYVPNSMVEDRIGNDLYFGSSHELMIYSTLNNTLAKADTTAPGVVLAVSPNDTTVLINDQVRQLFYIYSATGGVGPTFGGMGTAASWTPDSQTLYITDSSAANDPAAGITGHTDTLYVYNANTGFTSIPLTTSTGTQNLAITIPSVGAFLSGSPTTAHTWCPEGTVGNEGSTLFYPQGPTPDNTVAADTEVLTATTDGNHILGASLAGGDITLSDIGVTIPSLSCLPANVSDTSLPNGSSLSPLVLGTTLTQEQIPAPASTVNQVVPSPGSNLAFVTFNPAGSTAAASLPYYIPASSGTPAVVSSVPLTTVSGDPAPTAPLFGAFSPDSSYFFVSTAGDNLIHYITIPANPSLANPPVDSQQIAPSLPACAPTDFGCTFNTQNPAPASGIVPATYIAVKPRTTT